ncbi:TetR/AcrR family transcriptional regulator [Leucobacter sp. W1478]|uniref:TetR/AcrR family transcriptional regulator n=1 Tax=Leucobacter sp. W1478 TaxID=3439065 RepID=UPI003F2F2B04
MPNKDSQPQPGLRIRKKRATENAIEVSAVSLALEHGIEHVTVEMICEQADISRSTFFNYFAGRDYAIVGRAIEPLQGEEAAAVLASTNGDLVRGVIRLIFASIGHQHVNTKVARKRVQLSAAQPAALQLSSGILVEGSMKLIPVIAGWLAEHPEHAKLADPVQEATFAVGLAHAALGALISAMAQQAGDIAAGDAHVDDVLDQMRSVLG